MCGRAQGEEGKPCNIDSPTDPGVTIQGRAFAALEVDPQFNGVATSSCQLSGTVDTGVRYTVVGADVTLSGSGEERRWRVSNWSPASMLSSASGGPAAGQQGSNSFAIDRQTGADLESRVNPLWLLLAFVPLALVVLVVGGRGVRDWRRTAAVERAYRSTSKPS